MLKKTNKKARDMQRRLKKIPSIEFEKRGVYLILTPYVGYRFRCFTGKVKITKIIRPLPLTEETDEELIGTITEIAYLKSLENDYPDIELANLVEDLILRTQKQKKTKKNIRNKN